jgi:outer membrane lipoprotein SlyB
MKFVVLMILTTVLLAACGNRRMPIVDTKGIDMVQYRQDLFECQQYVEQVESKAAKGAVGGAIVGAAIGAVIGNSHIAKKGAGVGAIKGAVGGGVRTQAEKNAVLRNCLKGRGYNVLN